MLRGIRSEFFEDEVPLAGIARTPQARRRNLTAEKLAKLSLPAKLAWGWVVQNEMAMEGLVGAKHVKVLPYIDLAKSPAATAKMLFETCGLDWRPEAEAFVEESTQGTGRERYYELKRDPLIAAIKWRRRLSQDEIEEICDIAQQSEAYRMFADALSEEVDT